VRYVAFVVVFSIQLVAACAPRIAMQAPPQLVAADADAALLRGCYDCLIEAREIYRKLAVGGRAAAAAAWVFETDLLIALREKEIDLPASGALTEARRIAMELPRELEAARYIELVEAIPGWELGASRREVRELPATHAPGPTAAAVARACAASFATGARLSADRARLHGPDRRRESGGCGPRHRFIPVVDRRNATGGRAAASLSRSDLQARRDTRAWSRASQRAAVRRGLVIHSPR
jgi:hypothetical protein